MLFEDEGGVIQLLLDDPRMVKKSICDLSSLSVLDRSDRQLLFKHAKIHLMGKKTASQKSIVSIVLRKFGQFLSSDVSKIEGCLPVDFNGWQFLVLQYAMWYISTETLKANLKSRCYDWDACVYPWFVFLQENDVIPLGVVVPRMRLPREKVTLPSVQNPRLLGEAPGEYVNSGEIVADTYINKTIAGPIFWESDSEFLDAIEQKLRDSNKVLQTVLDDYWLKLLSDYRKGKLLLRKIPEAEWLDREKSDNWFHKKNCYLGSRANPTHGHLWILRFLRQQLQSGTDVDCFLRERLQQHPVVPAGFLKSLEQTYVDPLRNASALSQAQKLLLTPRQLFYRYLGILSPLDFTVAMAILLQEHPNLNPQSLASAKLLNCRGKSYFIVNEESRSEIFSVDKPRAKSRKYANLSHRALHVMRHLIRATEPIRNLLKRSGSPHWRYLFLGHIGPGKLGHPARILVERFNGRASGGVTFPDLYPMLEAAGLNQDSLNFAKIRNTQGVLEWFETGSIQQVSRRLGNTTKTVLRHYIPEVLLAAWNERIIRRFQNTLLILASHEEEWALEVVDMSDTRDLNQFLAQLVFEMREGSSPIADKIHENFGARFSVSSECVEADGFQPKGQLHIRLSSHSLALLLAYRQWAQNNLSFEMKKTPDRETGLPPLYFIDLAGMLQVAAVSGEIGEMLRESLDVAKLKRCYKGAVLLVPNYLNRLKRFTVHKEL